MWLPLVLVCSKAMCFTVGAPAFPTKDDCRSAMYDFIIPYIRQQAPEATISDYQCIQWEQRG